MVLINHHKEEEKILYALDIPNGSVFKYKGGDIFWLAGENGITELITGRQVPYIQDDLLNMAYWTTPVEVVNAELHIL